MGRRDAIIGINMLAEKAVAMSLALARAGIFVRSNLCAFPSNILRSGGNVVASISDVKVFLIFLVLVFRSFNTGTDLGR